MSDELVAVDELAFSIVSDRYQQAVGEIDLLRHAFNRGSDAERKAAAERVREELVLLQSDVGTFYGPLGLSYAILDTSVADTGKFSRVYFPASGEISEARVFQRGEGFVLDRRVVRRIPNWRENPNVVGQVAKVLLFPMPEAERAKIVGPSPYQGMHLAPATPE